MRLSCKPSMAILRLNICKFSHVSTPVAFATSLIRMLPLNVQVEMGDPTVNRNSIVSRGPLYLLSSKMCPICDMRSGWGQLCFGYIVKQNGFYSPQVLDRHRSHVNGLKESMMTRESQASFQIIQVSSG